MHIIEIIDTQPLSIISQLHQFLKGQIEDKGQEQILSFDNAIGKGVIRTMNFDWGVSLLDYNVNFSEDVKIIIKNTERAPIEFMFLSEGTLKFANTLTNKYVRLERFQNVIISNKINLANTYVFPERTHVKLNVILVQSKSFLKKSNSKSEHLHSSLRSVFEGDESTLPFQHLGGFNLKIADKINQLHKFDGNDMVRSLSIEGQLNLILAMQILEHENHENNINLNYSLSVNEIKKIHKLSNYILDNISSYSLTIRDLVEESGLSPKKLQQGFRMMYSKSINEYIRHLKMETARDLLRNSDQSISEIVYQIGYRSRSYFSKLFFEHYKILPTDYRDLIKNKNVKN